MANMGGIIILAEGMRQQRVAMSARYAATSMPRVHSGRYSLSCKDLTPDNYARNLTTEKHQKHSNLPSKPDCIVKDSLLMSLLALYQSYQRYLRFQGFNLFHMIVPPSAQPHRLPWAWLYNLLLCALSSRSFGVWCTIRLTKSIGQSLLFKVAF